MNDTSQNPPRRQPGHDKLCQSSQGKIYERNQFPYFLHLVEMLLLSVHENRQLAVFSNFATTFGLFGRDFHHQTINAHVVVNNGG
jgi:hypothetical protein